MIVQCTRSGSCDPVPDVPSVHRAEGCVIGDPIVTTTPRPRAAASAGVATGVAPSSARASASARSSDSRRRRWCPLLQQSLRDAASHRAQTDDGHGASAWVSVRHARGARRRRPPDADPAGRRDRRRERLSPLKSLAGRARVPRVDDKRTAGSRDPSMPVAAPSSSGAGTFEGRRVGSTSSMTRSIPPAAGCRRRRPTPSRALCSGRSAPDR